VSHGALDPSLARHLARIEAYVRHSGLQPVPPGRTDLRRALAAFMEMRTPALLDAWLEDVGPVLAIPEADWPEIKADQTAAVIRWARHVADPSNIETYLFLRAHTRRGFIGRFPASRFLAAQMRFVDHLADDIRREYAGDPQRTAELLSLLRQEFQARVLHITDFFVEAREEELLEQEASYRRAIDRAPACILMVDAASGIVFGANQVAERLLGYGRTMLVGRTLGELHPPSDRAHAAALWQVALERGHASGLLAAGIAHELRNPLAIVMNALYDLRQILDGQNPEAAEDLRIAEEEIERAQAIIKNLLEFSRESGAELERLDVNDLLSRTLQLMQKHLQNNGVRVTTELGPIPPCLANVNAMRQIFLNLITNAVQAMPEGGELMLRTALVGENRIRLDVRDTGVGIPREHLQDIFNPFYTTKAPGQGTGLGLSVVHSILQRYQGEIQVTSEVGAGTTFTIELPCQCHFEAD